MKNFPQLLCLMMVLILGRIQVVQSQYSICRQTYNLSEDDVVAETSDKGFKIAEGPEEAWYSLYTIIEDSEGNLFTVDMLLGTNWDLRDYYLELKDIQSWDISLGSGCVLNSEDLFMLQVKGKKVGNHIKLKFFNVEDNLLGETKFFSEKDLLQVFEKAIKSTKGELLVQKSYNGSELLSLSDEGSKSLPLVLVDISEKKNTFLDALNEYLRNYHEYKGTTRSIGGFEDIVSGKEVNISLTQKNKNFHLLFKIESNGPQYLSSAYQSIDALKDWFR